MLPTAATARSVQVPLSFMPSSISFAQGFIDTLFGSFIDAQGAKLKPSDVLLTRSVGGRRFQYIRTPRVLQEVRQHFNCSTLEGARLEALGGPGSAGSHWAYSLFQVRASSKRRCCKPLAQCALVE